jgi:hypothetical protein
MTKEQRLAVYLEDAKKHIEVLERELAETRAVIARQAEDNAQIYQQNQAIAAGFLQMREALEYFASLKLTDGTYADKCCVAVAALSIDTKPAEQIVAGIKAQALREAADEFDNDGEYAGHVIHLRRLADELESKCRKCGGNMIAGKAIQQTLTGTPDFPGDDHAVTLSPGGSGKLIDCLKCEKCGWSVTDGR